MANNKNLRPQTERTKSEQREIAKKGGIASGEARRRKKTIRETLEMMLSGQMPDGATRRDAIVTALLEKALSGDVRAFEAIRDSIGEKPTDKMAISNPDGSLNTPQRIILVAGERRQDRDTSEADSDI